MADDLRLAERLKALSESHTISPSARDRHRAMIREQLTGPPIISAPPEPEEPRSRKLVLVAATLAITAGVVFASSAAIRGDSPFSNDRTVEQTVSVPNGDTLADDRLMDLEGLIESGSTRPAITDAQDEAYLAIQGYGDDHPFVYRYNRLVLGARRGDQGLQPSYRYEGRVRWSDGATYRSSLPSGDLLTVEREGSEYQLTVSDGWTIEQSSAERWYVSELTAEVDPTVFEIQIAGDRVQVQLLDGSLVIGATERTETDGPRPTVRWPDRSTSILDATPPLGSAEQDVTSTTVKPDGATTPAQTATPPTTSNPPTTPNPPTTLAPPTTSNPPTTIAPPTTSSPPTTASPPTTICDDDDDDDDDEECDD